jgi:hypothetical protein
MAEELPEDSSILAALYPDEAKKIAQIEMLRPKGGVRRPQEGGLLARSKERERAAQLQPDFANVASGGSSRPQSNVAGIPGAPGAPPAMNAPGPGPGSQPPPSVQPGQIPGLGMVGGQAPTQQVPGVGGVQMPPPAGPRPQPQPQGGLPRATGRAGAPAPAPEGDGPAPGSPSSHEPSNEPAAAQIDPNSIEGWHSQAAKLRQQAYGLAPDPEVMAQERAKADENWFRGTMLQAMGGKAFAPTGGAVLQQALKRQSELELDPEKELQRKMRSLEGEAKALEDRASRAQSAVEKKELQAQAEAARAEQARLQREMITANRQIAAAQIAATREASREARADRDTDRRTDTVRREYNSRLDKLTQASGYSGTVLEVARGANIEKDPIAQYALITQFGKMLDPTSVVREAEQQMIEKARGMFGSIEMLGEKVKSGALLNKAQIQQIAQMAAEFDRGSSGRVEALNNFYRGVAERNKLPVADIVQGPISGGPVGGSGPGRGIDVGAQLGPQNPAPAPGTDRRRVTY